MSYTYVLSCDGHDRPGGRIARRVVKHLRQDGLRIIEGSICALSAERPGELTAFQDSPTICLNGCSYQCASKVARQLKGSEIHEVNVPDYLNPAKDESETVGDIAHIISNMFFPNASKSMELPSYTIPEHKDDILFDMTRDGVLLRVKRGLHYSGNHLWFALEKDIIRVGISDFLQQSLGDIYLLDLFPEGSRVEVSRPMGDIEASKKHFKIIMPLSGIIIERNEKLATMPNLINDAPYENWLFLIKPDNFADLDSLKDAWEYMVYILEVSEVSI
ncbi:MAG: putative zinc-binding protein [Candidatus Thorarchaeota archaeon]